MHARSPARPHIRPASPLFWPSGAGSRHRFALSFLLTLSRTSIVRCKGPRAEPLIQARRASREGVTLGFTIYGH